MSFSSSALVFLVAGLYMSSESFHTEIIGGREVQPHSRPFMASIQYRGKHICGGVLIHPQWVLTAAHCYSRGHSPTVVLGAHSLSKNEPMKQTFEIKEFIPFSGFKSQDLRTNDIMLIKEVTVTIISRKRCNSQSYYNHKPVITKDMICAGDARGQKDSCKGDSGGPLICKGVFHALVSGGYKCGISNKPGIYTLLTKKYQTWIKSKLAPSSAH